MAPESGKIFSGDFSKNGQNHRGIRNFQMNHYFKNVQNAEAVQIGLLLYFLDKMPLLPS